MQTDDLGYVLDANVFIEAKNRYYAFEIAPGFWEALGDLGANGRICSVDKVKEDLQKQKDELSKWAEKKFDSAFRATDTPEVITSYGATQRWANNQKQYMPRAKVEFAQGSDAYVIAFAHAHGCAVVTQEVSSEHARRRIKIPDVCKASEFNVRCVDLFQMLRELGVRFPSFTT